MALSINEIRSRALQFAKRWQGITSEISESQTFWNEFFEIFGISRRRVASFEKSVIRSDSTQGRIDLFWKGVLIVEHKSKDKSLNKAYNQAMDYFSGLREDELPKYVIVSDFARIKLYDLEKLDDDGKEIELIKLKDNIELFLFIIGKTKRVYKDEDPVNIKVAELVGKLHDSLAFNKYTGHNLEVFLVRIVFCLFADDTGVFPKNQFLYYLQHKTNIDGTDLGHHLLHLFQVLNTPNKERAKNLDEDLNIFPYVNGRLFEEALSFPSFDKGMRNDLIKCCEYDWSKVSPAIFGSMFQSIMDQDKRRNIGAYYTSEKNILKVISSLFLDDLRSEFKKSYGQADLNRLLKRIKNLRFLDPACGCGNFLVIAYRELRLLEIDIHKKIFNLKRKTHKGKDTSYNFFIEEFSGIDVDSMFGIEIEEFPAKIAETALWITDHLMNMRLSEEFGQYYVRLPFKKSPTIINDNALRIDWNSIVSNKKINYILGNPPFIGKQQRNKDQTEDINFIFSGKVKSFSNLDYVTSWYIKAVEYIEDNNIKVAFVSTNSITQGEQPFVLWQYLKQKNIIINFAHRTFKWNSEGRKQANVYVVIIGFSKVKNKANKKYLYEYGTPKSEALQKEANRINPYLIDGNDIIICNRNKPISDVPKIVFGNMPNDNGNFLLTEQEKDNLLKIEPLAEKYIRPLISAKEFLNNKLRYCLWLKDITPEEINSMPEIRKRIENVRAYRQNSKREATRRLADYSCLFGEIRQPKNDFIAIPLTTSENRNYIPIAMLKAENIPNNTISIIPSTDKYLFGILTSEMHMAWVKQVCGRLKGDFRYSNKLVYNNFPFPQNPSTQNKAKVKKLVEELINIRAKYKDQSLSLLYNPLFMPKDLLDIHKKIDKAVDLCYRPKRFTNELNRLEYLFDLYLKYTGELIHKKK
jgi:hypothetical protein